MEEEYSQFLEHVSQVKKLNETYRDYKRENQLMDYDDLIVLFRQILAEHEDIRRLLSEQYRYVMVDEYQDTNAIQADIVKWLAFAHRNVMVVGDDAQSIYSFRGRELQEHVRVSQAFSRDQDHPAGAELPFHTADLESDQRVDGASRGEVHQVSFYGASRVERGRRSWMRGQSRSRRCLFAGRSRNSSISGCTLKGRRRPFQGRLPLL